MSGARKCSKCGPKSTRVQIRVPAPRNPNGVGIQSAQSCFARRPDVLTPTGLESISPGLRGLVLTHIFLI